MLCLCILLVSLVAFGLLTPHVIRMLEGAATPARIAISVGLLLPVGLLMGTAFPLGMRTAAAKSAGVMPWLWGVNSATSVCASVLAVAIALVSGISSTFWTGCVCYLVAAIAFARASSPGAR
jgi:hypothetical protein